MSSQQIANHQEDAEIFHGDAVCKQKAGQLLEEMSLPRGLLPLDDLIEVGYNRITGFVWLKQRKCKEHQFTAIGRTVSYDNEVTAFVEEHRMWRLTGVKSKELLIWFTISEIFIDDSDPDKITFTNPTGISRSFPVSALEIKE
ncbi:hypothetical protein L484_021667 [Morus notabilis]|uniref:DUF538 domain-containing protein n=1 Tax=Morus notabilis TaxID=981085 RepID=W9SEQ0_9ROSA|nr:uncharacterized protein LOC21404517 isoform X2 [Morus notabilis]EXC29359.1 hypothetical protein L484_021667 [Morus notabilis]